MCKIVSFISCKGGVGKTTSAVNISSYIHRQGKRVLAVDLDSQHNLCKHFGIIPGHLKGRTTMYDLFMAGMNDCSPEEMSELVHSAIMKSTTVDVLPSTALLSSLDKILPAVTCRENILKEILRYVKDEYDYIFIDCHPGADLFAVNALTASNTAILPVEAHPLGVEGLDQVEKLITTVKRHLNPGLEIEGIILTKVQGNTNCCRDIRENIRNEFADRIKVFDDEIKLAIAVALCPAYGVSLHEFAPRCEPAKAYGRIALEVMFA